MPRLRRRPGAPGSGTPSPERSGHRRASVPRARAQLGGDPRDRAPRRASTLGWGPLLPCSQRKPGQAPGWEEVGRASPAAAPLLPELRVLGLHSGPLLCSLPLPSPPRPLSQPFRVSPVPDGLKVCRPQLQGIFTSQHQGWERDSPQDSSHTPTRTSASSTDSRQASRGPARRRPPAEPTLQTLSPHLGNNFPSFSLLLYTVLSLDFVLPPSKRDGCLTGPLAFGEGAGGRQLWSDPQEVLPRPRAPQACHLVR